MIIRDLSNVIGPRGDWSIPGLRVKRESEGKNRKYELI
jgi:hypothetical protein